MVPAAIIRRRWSGSKMEVLLPPEFGDMDSWVNEFGDNWFLYHMEAAEEWCWENYGIDWSVSILEWYEDEEEFLRKFEEL